MDNFAARTNNLLIAKPLPSNADEPVAVQFQLQGDQNSEIFRLQRFKTAVQN